MKDETPYEFGKRLGRVFAAPFVDAIKSAGDAAYAAGFASGAAAQRTADAAKCESEAERWRVLSGTGFQPDVRERYGDFEDAATSLAAAILAAPLAQPGTALTVEPGDGAGGGGVGEGGTNVT